MKIFIDDIRDPTTDGWKVVRNYNFAIAEIFIHWNEIEVISLDHDLGTEKTGYDIFLFIEEHVMRKLDGGKKVRLPEILVHSANPVGKANILRGYESLKKLVNRVLEE